MQETPSLSIREAFRTGIARLRDANVSSYTLAAELLLLHVLRENRTHLYAHPEDLLLPAQLDNFFALIARRAVGEPTQYLTGKQEFWGLEFEVTPDVLIPRPETEHVIEVALDRLALRERRANRPQKNAGAGFLFADIGTGSGCLAVVLAKEFPGAKIYATDVSPAALVIARRNATRHGVQNRINFVESNLANTIANDPGPAPPLSSAFDLVVSNPPYIPRRAASTLAREVRDHEPALALYGGKEGHELYASLIKLAAHHLQPAGIFVAELGHDSLPAVQPLLDSPSWRAVGVTDDLAGIPRIIAAERTATN